MIYLFELKFQVKFRGDCIIYGLPQLSTALTEKDARFKVAIFNLF